MNYGILDDWYPRMTDVPQVPDHYSRAARHLDVIDPTDRSAIDLNNRSSIRGR